MQDAARGPTLSLRGLGKTLTRGGERFEISAPEIELVAGQVTAIVGESGAGKSTLLDILALISAPDEAESFVLESAAGEPRDLMALWRAGDEAALAAQRRQVGLVLQNGGLLGFLSVAGNAALARRLAGAPPDRARIRRLAEELGVAARLGSRPATLSGGERQRAAILRALAHEPRLLVADEPTAAVDRIRAEAIMGELARQAEKGGAACVVVSHDLALVERFAHRVYRIEVARGADGVSRAVCARIAGGTAPAAPAPASPPRASAGGLGRLLLPARLAAQDLFWDARFTLASIAAIAAVIAPLLLLLGLKQGVVEHQVERLVEDPRSRELTPMRAVSLDRDAIERWRALPEVAFLTPGIARGASGVVARIADLSGGRAQERLMDLLATETGDPLLAENGAPFPRPGEAVLSHVAAVRLSQGGDAANMTGRTIDLLVSRRSGGKRQVQTARVKVAGVLDPRADPLERIYAPFEFVASVESYRAGERDALAAGPGASGAAARPEIPPGFDALLLLGWPEADPLEVATVFEGAAEASGGASPRRVADPVALYGRAAPEDAELPDAALLRAPGAMFGRANLGAAASLLEPRGGDVVGFVDPAPARFEVGGEAKPIQLLGEPPSEAARRLGLEPLVGDLAAPGTVPLAVPAEIAPIGARGRLIFGEAGEEISAPAEVVAHVEGHARAPLAIAAQVRAAAGRAAAFDPEAGLFRLAERRYRGFRLYARSIYDVERLHRRLAEEGVEAAARLGPIRTVQEIDLALTTLLALVGVIGVGGAFSAMAANLVSMVERKRGEIGLLRMLGLGRSGAFALPVVSAVLIAGAAAALACAVYAAIAAPINLHLAKALPFGDHIARLDLAEMGLAVTTACAAAALCAVFAARRAARVDPATALRRE